MTVEYDGGHFALRALSLALSTGERVALLGANGSGKTTCLQVLAGVLLPTDGAVRLHGEALDGTVAQRRRWRTHIGMVLADVDDQLIAPLVRDDVAFGVRNAAGRAHSASEASVQARVLEVLTQLGIASLADRVVYTLSLGERRRVAVAGVLVMRPQILLLDEPTANLDQRARRALCVLLDGAGIERATICLATHDTTFAAEWATRVVVLEEGRVIADGAPAVILRDHALLERAELDVPRFPDAPTSR